MKLAALILCGLTACGAAIAFPPSDYRSPGNAEIVMPDADRAADVARGEWESRLGDPVPGPLPRVRWFAGDPLWFKGQTVKVHSIYRGGHPGEIQIGTKPGARPSTTDLAHELLHWALYQTSGDGDAAHAGALWEQVNDVSARLREAGL